MDNPDGRIIKNIKDLNTNIDGHRTDCIKEIVGI
jgi:hypothetical protein